MKYIGTTETYDPCFIKDWDRNLLEVNLIISKELTEVMIDRLVNNKDKIIFHHTITGLGGTKFEPNVNPFEFEFDRFLKLIDSGFPISNYVLRVDPLIPITECMELHFKVMDLFNTYIGNLGLKLRCRISIIDLYSHVLNRFIESGVELPWSSFHAPIGIRKLVGDLPNMFNNLEFEACGEPDLVGINSVGCASNKDILILGKDVNEYSMPSSPQRVVCGCLAKKQILKCKPGRCPHGCIYCYWRD